MPTCAVSDCTSPAHFEVVLYDFYPDGTVFWEQDYTCPYICSSHASENEALAKGERKPRGRVVYPHTNRDGAQGFSIYRPLSGVQ